MTTIQAYLVRIGAAEYEVTGFDEAGARGAARKRYIDAYGDYQVPIATVVRALPIKSTAMTVEAFVREFGPGIS